jgi:hypothetical protein
MHYFRSTGVAKHPFYYIRPEMMFGNVSEHSANLQHIKRCNNCVSVLNALFRGIKVVVHPFYSIRPKMMFGCVLDHFANLRTNKDENSCFGPECTISGY